MFHLLSLGDSYTIGEGVITEESFPFLTTQLLRERGVHFGNPDVVAKTGWTTDELMSAVMERKQIGLLRNKYDVVTLLIGVNNQYRGRQVSEFENEFRLLLEEAIHFAGGRSDHVIVLSIPDWGRTPFAEDRDRVQISREIDLFNASVSNVANAKNIKFIDITPGTRLHASEVDFLAADGLHPSSKEYKLWANQLVPLIEAMMK